MEIKGFFLTRLRFHFHVLTDLYAPPYKGALCRSAFGAALRRTSCTQKIDCHVCLLQRSCAYYFIFDRKTASGDYRNHQDPPRPYVIEPPLDITSHYQPGSRLIINVVLIGSALPFIDYVVRAMQQMGESGMSQKYKERWGKMFLDAVETIEHPATEKGTVIYDGKNCRYVPDIMVTDFTDLAFIDDNTKNLTLMVDFLTPTFILHWGRIIQKDTSHTNDTVKLDFSIFIKALLIRTRYLRVLGEFAADLDEKLIESKAVHVETTCNALKWYDQKRYTSRQKETLKLGGFMGRISFHGPIGPFLPLIRLGEYIHVGGRSTFGLGMYRISEESDIL